MIGDSCMAFIREVGYPVIVKPDNGVGASSTYKLNSEDEVGYSLLLKIQVYSILWNSTYMLK